MTEGNIAEIKLKEFNEQEKKLIECRSPITGKDNIVVEAISLQSEKGKGIQVENSAEAITELGATIPARDYKRKDTKKSQGTDR